MKYQDKITKKALEQANRALDIAEANGAKKSPAWSIIKFGTVLLLAMAIIGEILLSSLQAGPQPNFLRWILHVGVLCCFGFSAIGAIGWVADWLMKPPKKK